MATDFDKSMEAAFRKSVRDAVRKSKELTLSQKNVALYIVNLWLHHRNGPEGLIRPGRARISKKVEVSPRTVSTVLKMMREGGVLIPVGNEAGGNGPTRYTMRLRKIFGWCGHKMPEFMRGELVEIYDSDPCKNFKPNRAKLQGCPF